MLLWEISYAVGWGERETLFGRRQPGDCSGYVLSEVDLTHYLVEYYPIKYGKSEGNP